MYEEMWIWICENIISDRKESYKTLKENMKAFEIYKKVEKD